MLTLKEHVKTLLNRLGRVWHDEDMQVKDLSVFQELKEILEQEDIQEFMNQIEVTT